MKNSPIFILVLFVLFFPVDNSRADLFGNILNEVEKAVSEIDKSVGEINKEVDKPENTSKEKTQENTHTDTNANSQKVDVKVDPSNVVSKFGIPMTTMGDVVNTSNCKQTSSGYIKPVCVYQEKNIYVYPPQDIDFDEVTLKTPVGKLKLERGQYQIDTHNDDLKKLKSKYKTVFEPSDRQKKVFNPFECGRISWLFYDDKPNSPPYIQLATYPVLDIYSSVPGTYKCVVDIYYRTEKSGLLSLEELIIERGDGIENEL